MPKVFVYGTLRKGESRSFLLTDCKFLGYAKAKGFLLYNVSSFPGMVPGEGEVIGEVYEIPESLLEKLDKVEDVPNLFRRELIEVVLEDGIGILAYVYLYNKKVDNKLLIPSGDWKDVSKF
ncbi:gamma-glutamylcyclotransferase [Thermodesulfobacterium sp. TA1]|uniref:gamma-glutamylcyclotransferase family protein n=1 Tax=Thermodesulfobacterium sp. TA1 TaxID=2234087 RepID=UPI001232B8EB|nr:gamma-glutamylcyclotransferase family protein [Thermodesulfobacterium sp. TA1]QER41617.1 gamma-glutamylcyclotransferase [Thermodesulfobacterium sp. TA1]